MGYFKVLTDHMIGGMMEPLSCSMIKSPTINCKMHNKQTKQTNFICWTVQSIPEQ